jgi:hypothetical protein
VALKAAISLIYCYNVLIVTLNIRKIFAVWKEDYPYGKIVTYQLFYLKPNRSSHIKDLLRIHHLMALVIKRLVALLQLIKTQAPDS